MQKIPFINFFTIKIVRKFSTIPPAMFSADDQCTCAPKMKGAKKTSPIFSR